MDWNDLPFHPRQLRVPSGAPKTTAMPMVYSAQTMHLSCVEINTISKWTKMIFHLTHVTKEYHRWCPKWFSSLWYVLRKLCPYLASRLILSPNRLKQASTRSTIGLPKAISEPMVHLAQIVHISCLEIKTISKRTETTFPWPTSPRCSIECA
jgi:hypothetical protein